MKTILKNFIYILSRFKTSSILNILGLSAAIFIFFIIAIQVHHDLTFNSNFQNVENLYQLTKLQATAVDQMYIKGMTVDEVNILTNGFPEIQNTCLTTGGNNKQRANRIEPNGESTAFAEYTTTVTKEFNAMFKPQILEGSIEQAFNMERSSIISKKTALRMFGKESPINKVVEISSAVVDIKVTEEGYKNIIISTRPRPFTIKAVYEDFPENCSINNGFIIYSPAEEYMDYSDIFIQINKEDKQQLVEKMNDTTIINQLYFMSYKPTNNLNIAIDRTNSIKLAPLKNIHINYPEISSKAQEKKNIFFMISIALFALIIAYINLVNFTIAMAPARIRAINIRMILGADKMSIRLILASEALFLTLCAILIAFVCLVSFQNSEIAQMFTADMAIGINLPLLVSLIVVLSISSFAIGIYPAYYITTFDLVVAIKSSSANNISTSKLRNVLVIIQLVAAISFITIAIFIKMQHNYLTNYSLGFDRDKILVLWIKDRSVLDADIKTFAEEVARNPIISDYTSSSELIGKAGNTTMGLQQDSMVFSYNTFSVQDNLLSFFNIPIVEGENINKDMTDNRSKSVVNEQFLKLHNIKDGLVGLQKTSFSGNQQVGIVKDFHYSSLFGEVGALEIKELDINESSYLYFKPSSNNMAEVRKHIEDVWKKIASEEIDLQFLDENINQLYEAQENLAKTVSIVSIIIILIAIMGIYGLTSFNTKYRTKELAIRRVNGAEVYEILLLINKSLFVQFIIAFIISVPIVYYTMNLWAQQFPYHIQPAWWIFALGGFCILLITAITVSLQCYRAATANPMDSLKSE